MMGTFVRTELLQSPMLALSSHREKGDIALQSHSKA
jgi:hypothetical protein